MNKRKQKLVRFIAIALVVLLTLSIVISALVSFAYAEESTPAAQDKCELTIEYLGNEQALRISQRLVYTNVSEYALDRVVFYAPANLFRRQSSLPYDAEETALALPEGYLPGGIDLSAVRVNGEACDWGFQGADEMFLRVACSLQPGESARFEFDYYLLLTENAAFMGISENEWRLSDFYFAPAATDENGEFILNMPVSFTRYLNVPAMDFSAALTLPERWSLAATGTEEKQASSDGYSVWTAEAKNVHDFALVLLKDRREHSTETASGVQLRVLTEKRSTAKDILAAAQSAVETCETWFGSFPFRQIDILQTGYGPSPLPHSAVLWLDDSSIREGDRTLEQAVRSFIVQQYFGRSAWVHPAADAWLSDSVSEYLGYLLLEEANGHDAYLKALNEDLVDSLQLTIPGGLRVNSDASLFTAYEYDIIVRNRGAIVFHELRTAMGREELIRALRLYYELGQEKTVLTEMDLVACLDEASGKSWEKFLTDWVFNVGDYVNQDIYWLE